MQDRRCIYFNQPHLWRSGLAYCFKTGGSICHQIPNSPVCRAIYYSDVATALIAYEAEVEYIEDGETHRTDLKSLIERHSVANGLACQKLVCDLVSTRLPKAYGFDPVRDIQVLCPTKVGPTGSVELNRRLQDILNPPAKGKGQIGTAESAKILRLGDKVMQVKNDYDITFERAGAEAGVGAYNGDLGIITAVDVDARSVTVQMDDKKYTYTADQLNELEPAYAVTVHKSQGSEFPAVILPVADVPARLCYRNLLYTGVTRARKLCVLTGTARTEQTMVENVRQNMRYSGLRYLLKDAATPTEEKQEQLSAT